MILTYAAKEGSNQLSDRVYSDSIENIKWLTLTIRRAGPGVVKP